MITFPSKKQHMPEYLYPKPGTTVNMPAFDEHVYGFRLVPHRNPRRRNRRLQIGELGIDHLKRDHDKPFFLACGIYRPHVPWYVPQKYFDMFPLEIVQLPKVLENDLDDRRRQSQGTSAHRSGNYHEHVLEAGQWKNAVQGYLASIAYADAMVGKLLDELENSPHADNTIIVLWSDHGWQLGEKEHWRKFAMWENTVKTVMMMKVPKGIAGLPEGSKDGDRCDRVTSLMDIYPTLVDLCGLPAKPNLDGRSLVPLLKNPAAPWDYPALTTYDYSEFTVRTEDWRYTRYIDDSEELYDHRTDEEEWTNLADDPKFAQIKKEMAAHIPTKLAPVKDTSYKLEPHHIPPLKSKEDYLQKKAARKK